MEKIKISNFRKVGESWELELAPVTFFTGTNNSGKSTVLKALMVLSDFAVSQNHLQLSFSGPNRRKHKIDSYNNAINWYSEKSNKYDLEFSYTNRNYTINLIFSPAIGDKSKTTSHKGSLLSMIITREEDGSQFELSRTSKDSYQLSVDGALLENNRSLFRKEDELKDLERLLSRTDEQIRVIQDELNSLEISKTKVISLRQDLNKATSNKKSIQKKIKELMNLSNLEKGHQDFNPSFDINDLEEMEPTVDRIIRRVLIRYFRQSEKELGKTNISRDSFKLIVLGDLINSVLTFSVDHLSPHRNSQTRLYINDETSDDIYEIINVLSKNPINKKSKAGIFLKDWMNEFDIGEDYNIKIIEGMASIIEIKENDKLINLVDKGFGAGQVFTILLKIAQKINEIGKRRRGDKVSRFGQSTNIILIEEPEANLHPALQSKLADLFYHAWKDFKIKFVIETHSEYIIRRTQLISLSNNQSLDRKSDPNPFKVYYFHKDKGPYEMEYREDGVFKNDFDTGFFDVSSKQAIRLLKKRR